MDKILVKWADPIPPGKYTASKKLITIEDPRNAKYYDKKIMKGDEWETRIISAGQEFKILGNFTFRGKIWYNIENLKAKKPQVINHIVMINVILKPS